jgi:DNA polymerase V
MIGAAYPGYAAFGYAAASSFPVMRNTDAGFAGVKVTHMQRSVCRSNTDIISSIMHTATHLLTLSQTPLQFPLGCKPQAVPLLLHKIAAGFPSPAADYVEASLDLNAYLIQHKAATFMFEVTGDSMINAGIFSGDKVAVDRSIEPRHRHIVVAVVDSEYTIKRLYRRAGRVELRPENPAYAPIVMGAETQLEIWGVVVGVVRRYTA